METQNDLFAVSVGKTAYPLKSDAKARGPVLAFPDSNALGETRLLDGPPYANGAPHLGHVLNKHLKDAVARALSAKGYQVEWRPGWDCHGLPLELAVEKKGANRKDPASFLAAAKEFAQSQVDVQREVFEQQGWCADWNNGWMTMQPEMEAGTLRVFAKLLNRNLLDVRFTAVPWCPACQSTLAGAEQEEKSLTVESWLVPLVVQQDKGEVKSGDVLLSWTTTPWTLPLHCNLTVNPEADFVRLVLPGGEKGWVSADTAERWSALLEAHVDEVVVKGQDLEGVVYQNAAFKTHEVAVSQRVLPEAGTGVLHAVPGLSDLDTVLGQEKGWTLVQYLSVYGKVQNSPLEAQNGLKAGSEGNELLKEYYAQNAWFRPLPYTSEHAHCWRHKLPLLTRASRQVFLKLTDEVRERAMKMVNQMEFTPATGKARLLGAMKNRPDWCLSRQRTWGVPLALFLDKETGQPHPLASLWMMKVANAVEEGGVQEWWSHDTQYWLGKDANAEDVDRVDDVLDVWFDSGVMPQLVGASEVVLEGSDQHRGWFQSCLWVAAALGDELPFHRVVTHGFVVDGSGQKLSKSAGGDKAAQKQAKPVSPWSEQPTDVVRVWALTGAEGADKSWTAETLTQAQSAVSRWRGAVRFMVANSLDTDHDFKWKEVPAWDRYWLDRSQQVCDEVLDLVAKGYTGEAVSVLSPFAEEFSSVCLGSWKDRLYCAPHHARERQVLDGVLKAMLGVWLKMLGVMTPRLTQEAYAHYMAHDKAWPGDNATGVYVTEEELKQVQEVLAVRKKLAPALEKLGSQKVGTTKRQVNRWEGAPAWEGQLLADALDVGEVVESLNQEQAEWVFMVDEKLGAALSPHVVCPRCRRSQKAWTGEVCTPCYQRVLG